MLRAKMEYKCSVILTKALILFVLVNCVHSAAAAESPRHVTDGSKDPNRPCVACGLRAQESRHILERPVLTATRTHHDAVMGSLMTISRTTSLRTCSQTGTPLRPMQRAFGTTTLLSLPLLTTSPMALVLPTSTPPSLEPKKSQLFLPMLAPEPPVSTS